MKSVAQITKALSQYALDDLSTDVVAIVNLRDFIVSNTQLWTVKKGQHEFDKVTVSTSDGFFTMSEIGAIDMFKNVLVPVKYARFVILVAKLSCVQEEPYELLNPTPIWQRTQELHNIIEELWALLRVDEEETTREHNRSTSQEGK